MIEVAVVEFTVWCVVESIFDGYALTFLYVTVALEFYLLL